MRGRTVSVLIAVLLLCACGPRAGTGGSHVSGAAGDSATADESNPTLAPLAMDQASTDFCEMRTQGPAELISFLNMVETCDSLTDSRGRADARCGNLGADETRLRNHYAANNQVMDALSRARSRPWPACAMAAPATDASDAAAAEGDQTDATPADQPADASGQ